MANTVGAESVLKLIDEDIISHPIVRKEVLQAAAETILGNDIGSLKETISALNPEETSEIKKIASDLRNVAVARRHTEEYMSYESQMPSVQDIKDRISLVFSDDDIKDRISRVFMSSSAFRICAGVLGLGAALFGINMGVLTFDTTAANKIKTEASVAANDAKTQADNAKNTIASAISTMQLDMPKLVTERINIQEVQKGVATLLSERFDPKISGVDEKITKATNDINEQNFRLDKNKLQISDLQRSADNASTKYLEAQKLLERWESSVQVVNKTTADQTLARSVWLVLRQDALFLVGSFVFSLFALAFALWSLMRRHRQSP